MAAAAHGARARVASVGVAMVLAVVLLYYSLRGIDWHEVARLVAGASPGYLAAVAAISTMALLLRALRWRVLLNAHGSGLVASGFSRTRALTLPTVFWATAAGYFGNNFLPARAGELVRTLMISSRSGLEVSYVFATALSERLADVIALVSIGAAVVLTLPAPPRWLAGAIRPLAVVALLGAAAIAVLPLLAAHAPRALARAPLPASVRPKVAQAIDDVLRGMRAFHHPGRLGAFVGLTAVIWTLDAIAVVMGGLALGLTMPVPVAFLLIAALGLGSALPSTPGYVGIYQFVAVTVLMPFGFSRVDAIAYILVAQAVLYVVIGFWGSWALFRYRWPRPQVSRHE
jgi:uncharacterized protein (TIRG00374 family)